jgi:hypothetical protein
MKKTLFLFLFFTQYAFAQTNVSGGIYSNTTWTLANSPYIVIDTTVVFPGVTLTIQPGVVVEFNDHIYLEIRQANLIAVGTASDSITFTSTSSGLNEGVVLNSSTFTIDYCIFEHANNALTYHNNVSFVIQHSSFYSNTNAFTYTGAGGLLQNLRFSWNSNCFVGGGSLDIQQSSFDRNTNCLYILSSGTNLNQCTFSNNTYCIGGPLSTDYVLNVNMNNCLFDNNYFVGHLTGINSVINTSFLNNTYVIRIGGSITNSNSIRNCIFCNNNMCLYSGSYDSLINCNFSGNGIGTNVLGKYMKGNIFVDNDTAAKIGTLESCFDNYIYHNRVGVLYNGGALGTSANNYICNNSLYNIIYTGSSNASIAPLCYCETDSATIRSKIYDGYVDVTRGLLTFTPFVNCDSSAITSIPPLNCVTIITTGMEEQNNFNSSAMNIYPNPTHNSFTISLSTPISNFQFQLSIYDVTGRVVHQQILTSANQQINNSFSPGIYFIKVTEGEKVWTEKVVVE